MAESRTTSLVAFLALSRAVTACGKGTASIDEVAEHRARHGTLSTARTSDASK